MQLISQCPFCRWSKKIKGLPERKGGSLIANSDNNILKYDCWEENHVSIIYFSEKKFEILFESGLKAISDYYYREAVASLASALERFYEYCIELILFDKIDNEIYDKSWKHISNQSERQIGAFIFIFLQEFKEVPFMLNNKSIAFRNKVIHKGYFPNLKETKQFLHNIFDTISNILTIIKRKKPDYIKNYDLYFLKKMQLISKNEIEELKSKIQRPNCILVPRPFYREISTFLSDIFYNEIKNSDLDKYLEEIRNKEYYI